jgi:cytolysin (calcineurin-like family phosphatase)
LRIVVNVLFALAILLPSLWGFSMKFREFVMLARGDVEGVFAVTPVMNYLLASFGFLLLFGWAAANGMFHDIEKPKQTMLENEERLDAWEHERDERKAANRGRKGSL